MFIVQYSRPYCLYAVVISPMILMKSRGHFLSKNKAMFFPKKITELCASTVCDFLLNLGDEHHESTIALPISQRAPAKNGPNSLLVNVDIRYLIPKD